MIKQCVKYVWGSAKMCRTKDANFHLCRTVSWRDKCHVQVLGIVPDFLKGALMFLLIKCSGGNCAHYNLRGGGSGNR